MVTIHSTNLTPVVIGASFRSSSMELRDYLFVEDEATPRFLRKLKKLGMRTAIILSTCDRVEVQGLHQDLKIATEAIYKCFQCHSNVGVTDLQEQCYNLEGDTAIRHMFRVAASLESQIIGEPQVLGQVKAAHKLSKKLGMIDNSFEAILQACYGAAKRVRSETLIGSQAVSIASAALQVSRDVHGDLTKAKGILIGDGEMGALLAEKLVKGGLERLTVIHENMVRAEAMAQRFLCQSSTLEKLPNEMAAAEIIIVDSGQRDYILTNDLVQSSLKLRRRKPVFIVDLGISCDVEPSVHRIDEVFLYDIHDLESIALDGLYHRKSIAGQAGNIIDQELHALYQSKSERNAVPIINKLRNYISVLRSQALYDSGGDAERATHLLTTRLLHEPSVNLRRLAQEGHQLEDFKSAEKMLIKLFNLDSPVNPPKDRLESTGSKKL